MAWTIKANISFVMEYWNGQRKRKLIVPIILFFIIIVILNIYIRIFCAAYVVFCLFLGGPIKGVCVEARTALKTSAIRCVWPLMSVFQPFDSITSVARLWWEGSRENKSGWTLQNLHCNWVFSQETENLFHFTIKL